MVRSKCRDSLTYKRSVLYSNLHPPGYQSETIAFTPTKNAPPDGSEGALYQNWSL